MKSADATSRPALRRARDRIDRDYAEQVGIPALAAGAGYSRGTFTQPPTERPHGVEAIMRDDTGNWYSFTQAHYLTKGPRPS